MAVKPVANPSYEPLAARQGGYQSFTSFYPFYLGEHNNPVCRRLHLVGTGVSFAILTRVLLSGLPKLAASPSAPLALQRMLPDLRPLELAQPAWKYIAGGLFQNYFVAWVGHFFFEHNKPATFKYPLYSFIGDVRMFFEVILGRRKP